MSIFQKNITTVWSSIICCIFISFYAHCQISDHEIYDAAKHIEQNIRPYYIPVAKNVALGYGAIMTHTLGHELGHVALPFLYGDKPQIKIRLNSSGSYSVNIQNMPRSFLPAIHVLGPIGGIVTCFGLLKGFTFYEEYKKYHSLKKAFTSSIQKPLLNKEQPFGLQIGAVYCCIAESFQFVKAKGVISDGENLCNSLKLSGYKATLARSSLACGTLGIIGYALAGEHIKDFLKEHKRVQEKI